MLGNPKNQLVNFIPVYSGTGVTAGSKCEAVLTNLEPRPNGKFALAVALLVKLVFTATETGTASTLTLVQKWSALSTLHLKHKGNTRFNSFSGLSLIRRITQMDEIFGADILGDFIPTTTTAHGAGPVTITMKVLVPLAHEFFQPGKGSLDGYISLADLKKHGSLNIVLGAGLLHGTAGNDWSYSTADVNISLVTVEVDELPEPLRVLEIEETTADSSYQLEGDADRVRRITGLLVCDDTTGALTQPTAFSVAIDRGVRLQQQDGDDWVDLANCTRDDGINDIVPACLPLVWTTRRQNIELPLVYESATLHSVGAAHSGSYKVLQRIAMRLTDTEVDAYLADMGLDAATRAAYLAELRTRAPQSVASVNGVPLNYVNASDYAGTGSAVISARAE